MRVLAVVRDDYRAVFGGDSVMVENFQRCLNPLGIDLEILSANELSMDHRADLVHLTFLHIPDSATRAIRWAKERRIPVAMSPLFEDPLRLWFEWARYHPTKWRALSRMVGRKLGRMVYLAWQGGRRRSSTLWQQQRAILQEVTLVPNSHYELDQLKHWFDLASPDAYVVPLGIDADVWSGSQAYPKHPVLATLSGYVLQVSRIETRKNQIALLHALADASMPIVFLGKDSPHEYEAPYVRACHDLAEKRGNVHFIDWLPLEAMPALYGKAAVHVLPSWSELPGLVTLEAAACGCKVVSTSLSPIREYLGEDVWCCHPESDRAVKDSVQQALNSPTPVGLRTKVLESLTWQNSAVRLADVYNELTS